MSISPEDRAQLEETLALLSAPQELAEKWMRDTARRDVVRRVDAVRALRP